MKSILILTIIAFFSSCKEDESIIPESIPDNYVVILDLSDRLISHPNQTDIDTCIIRSVFEEFESSVMTQLIVKSKDKFSIRIIPQKGSSVPVNEFENSLSIDMAIGLAANKHSTLNNFKHGLGDRLNLLYQQAMLGNKTDDYEGVDIWQYFNVHINSDILDAYDNHIIVVTDGYFDFEDLNRGLNSGNKSTVSRILLSKMSGLNWQEKTEKDSMGLLPVELKSNASFIIVGIQPKTSDELESQKLTYLWTKWLRESGVQMIMPVQNSSSAKMKSQIKSLL